MMALEAPRRIRSQVSCLGDPYSQPGRATRRKRVHLLFVRERTAPKRPCMILSGAYQRNPTNATGSVQLLYVWKVARRKTVIATPISTIALDREIRWNNPDPPYEEYRYPYYLRSGPDALSELLEKLGTLATDRFVIVTDGTFPSHLAQAFREKISAIAPCTLLTF